MTSLLLTLLLAYALMLVFMGVFQRRLMYFPDTNVEAPAYYGLDGFEDIRTQSSGGAVQMWYRGAAAGFPTIVYFHGNASHLGFRAKLLAALARQGFGVLALHYRGYGKSEGEPGERALTDDALAIYDAIAGRPDVDAKRIVVYGRSLGTAVAVHVAAARPVAGVILASPFDSLVAVGRQHYPWLPVSLLLRHRFDAASLARGIQAPMLALVGDADSIVSPARSRALFDAWGGPKTWRMIGGANHNDLSVSPAFWDSIVAFLREGR